MTTASRLKHILFVDDDPGARLIVETMLRARLPGVRVTTAIHGAQALAVLERGPVDLMITDLGMPVMDGVELLLNIAQRRILVPVLVVTANGSPAAETVALAGGAIELRGVSEVGPQLAVERAPQGVGLAGAQAELAGRPRGQARARQAHQQDLVGSVAREHGGGG